MSQRKGFDSAGLGDRIREARDAAGLTQGAAAKRLKVSQPTLSRWESGETVPDVADLVEMCRIYKAGLAALVLGHGTRSPAELQIAQIREILGATPAGAAAKSARASHSQRLARDAREAAEGSSPPKTARG